jgi:hypothetical protein
MKSKPHTDHHSLKKISKIVAEGLKALDATPLEEELVRLEFELLKKKEATRIAARNAILRRKISSGFSPSTSPISKAKDSIKGYGGRLKS